MSSADLAQWHTDQIERYQDEFPIYKLYAQVVHAVMRHGCARRAPLAIVESRPKAVTSFAEKALRKKKAEDMDDPVTQLTDLCGGRAIASTRREVDALCRFVRERFVIVSEEDIATRLSPAEFGYLSVHFLVHLDAKTLAGVSLPEELPSKEEILETIGDRTGEIQLRTVPPSLPWKCPAFW